MVLELFPRLMSSSRSYVTAFAVTILVCTNVVTYVTFIRENERRPSQKTIGGSDAPGTKKGTRTNDTLEVALPSPILVPQSTCTRTLTVPHPISDSKVTIGSKSCTCLEVSVVGSNLGENAACKFEIQLRAPNRPFSGIASFEAIFSGVDATHVTTVNIKYRTLQRVELETKPGHILLDADAGSIVSPKTVSIICRSYVDEPEHQLEVKFDDEIITTSVTDSSIDEGVRHLGYEIPSAAIVSVIELKPRPFRALLTASLDEASASRRFTVENFSTLKSTPGSVVLATRGNRTKTRVAVSSREPFRLTKCYTGIDGIECNWSSGDRGTVHLCSLTVGKNSVFKETIRGLLHIESDAGESLDIPLMLLADKDR